MVNLRERITFQIKNEITGPIINFESYTDYKTLWAEARFLRGRNYYADRATNIKNIAITRTCPFWFINRFL